MYVIKLQRVQEYGLVKALKITTVLMKPPIDKPGQLLQEAVEIDVCAKASMNSRLWTCAAVRVKKYPLQTSTTTIGF